jgi:hypothetical protein
VEVVVEHAEGVKAPGEAPASVVDPGDDRIAVVVVADDALPVNAADGDVEEAVVRHDVRARVTRHYGDRNARND